MPKETQYDCDDLRITQFMNANPVIASELDNLEKKYMKGGIPPATEEGSKRLIKALEDFEKKHPEYEKLVNTNPNDCDINMYLPQKSAKAAAPLGK